MNNNTTYVAATRVGAAFPGVLSAWTDVSGAGANHARKQNPVLVAGLPEARCAVRPIPAPMMQSALVMAELPAVNGTRKQTTHTTRITAGGFGAMGPHPDREPA